MHKFILDVFDCLKSLVRLTQALLVLLVLLTLLYWIQNLTHGDWQWMNSIKPIIESFLSAGAVLCDEKAEMFGAVFEYKYPIALLLIFALYYIGNLAFVSLDSLEDTYGDGRRLLNKIEEDAFNKKMEKNLQSEQKMLKNYKIYVGTSIKKKFSHKELNISLDEQNKIMNKFLIEQTSVMPEPYEGGFLYSFSSFERIDSILPIFFKLINSTAPLDFVICVQVFGRNRVEEDEQLKKLINLKLLNKVSLLSDTALRYGFNISHRYGVSQLGVFRKDGKAFEVHEFLNIN